jgi:Cu/Ag efflux pump CusA
MGTAVIGGMLTSSAIAIFVIPALFYVVEKLSGAKHPKPASDSGMLPAPGTD